MNEQQPKQSAKVTLIKKPGCTPCAMMDVALRGEGVEFTTIDITENQEVIEQYDIQTVPVLVIERQSEGEPEVLVLNGFQSIDEVKALI